MYGDLSDGYGPISDYDEYDPLMPMEPVALTAKENKSMSMKPVKVKVIEPFRVLHPDTHEAHTDGDVITVPEHLADEWAKSGWVKPVTTTKEKS
jgi:hypothetical protein